MHLFRFVVKWLKLVILELETSLRNPVSRIDLFLTLYFMKYWMLMDVPFKALSTV